MLDFDSKSVQVYTSRQIARARYLRPDMEECDWLQEAWLVFHRCERYDDASTAAWIEHKSGHVASEDEIARAQMAVYMRALANMVALIAGRAKRNPLTRTAGLAAVERESSTEMCSLELRLGLEKSPSIRRLLAHSCWYGQHAKRRRKLSITNGRPETENERLCRLARVRRGTPVEQELLALIA